MRTAIKWTSIITLTISVCAFICHLEYYDYKGSTLISMCGLVAIPVAIMLSHQLHCMIRLLLLVLYGPVLFIFLLSGMCAYTPTGKAYICKNNSNIMLVEKSLDCGAWDSSPAYSIDKEVFFTQHLKYVTGFTNTPDTTEWKITKP